MAGGQKKKVDMRKGKPTGKLVEYKAGTLEKLADPNFPQYIRDYHEKRARIVRGLNNLATGLLDEVAVTEQVKKLVAEIDEPGVLDARQKILWRARLIRMAGQVGALAAGTAQKEAEIERGAALSAIGVGSLGELSTEELRRLLAVAEDQPRLRLLAEAPVEVALEVKE